MSESAFADQFSKFCSVPSYSPRSLQQRPPSLSRPSSGDQRRPRSDHLLPTASSRNRSKHRSNSNDSRRSGSETRHRSTSLTKRSPSPAGKVLPMSPSFIGNFL